jgi:quercetin dioxygenase-like cupin family protein
MKRIGTAILLGAMLGLGTVQGPSTAWADGAKVTPLMRHDLLAAPGKEVDLLTVEYAPGASTPPHRHNAQAFVYVLEGRVEMQVKGGKLETLGPGQTFYEGPHDLHIVSKNASQTEPAKFLVLIIKNKGAPVLVPAK